MNKGVLWRMAKSTLKRVTISKGLIFSAHKKRILKNVKKALINSIENELIVKFKNESKISKYKINLEMVNLSKPMLIVR